MTTGRWKLFGDEREEQSIACRGLCWFGRDVVIVAAACEVDAPAQSGGGDACELLFLPRAQLSKSACLSSMRLPGRRAPRFLDCNELFLVLFTRDAFFYQYELKTTYHGDGSIQSITTQLMHQVSIYVTML